MQIQLYKEDFSIERRDRERAQSEKDYLQQQLKDAQEIIATLLNNKFTSSFYFIQIQWNSVNLVTNGPKKLDHNIEVTILTRISLRENVLSFLWGTKKSGRGGLKAGFHRI